MKGKRSARRARRQHPSLLERINPDVAGIDCGSREHYVAVPAERDPEPVQHFGSDTAELIRLAEWLRACGVKSVAMEATGVYWIPLYEILEERGLTVLLVNARHVKNVPGRKTDVQDCEWLRELHSVGLLRGSFRPADQIVALRGYMRHRDVLVEEMSTLVQRMQKALLQMNLQLTVVLTDITGVTGMKILRDIVAGHTDPEQLARHRHARCHATAAEILAALTGNYRPEHVFVLQQNLELYDVYQQKLEDCDRAIEQHLQKLVQRLPTPTAPLPPARKRLRRQGHEPNFDVRRYLYHLTGGVDLTQMHAVGPYTALRLISETGTDMSRWRSADAFASWLSLAPDNKITGGRLISSHTPLSANRAATMLRLVALGLAKTQTALGAFYRRLAAHIDKPKAITATARKAAILIYRMLKGELIYQDPGPDAYNAQQHQRLLRRLRQRAQHMGYALINVTSGELLADVVVS